MDVFLYGFIVIFKQLGAGDDRAEPLTLSVINVPVWAMTLLRLLSASSPCLNSSSILEVRLNRWRRCYLICSIALSIWRMPRGRVRTSFLVVICLTYSSVFICVSLSVSLTRPSVVCIKSHPLSCVLFVVRSSGCRGGNGVRLAGELGG
jgi:hypothetical protein